MTEYQYQSALL